MPTASTTPIATTVESALLAGALVVLRCRGPADIEVVRRSTRRASAWLHSMVPLSPGRLCRSATHGMGLVAAHCEFVVGVDVEHHHGARALHEVGDVLLHVTERDALTGATIAPACLAQLWVRKEAVLKAFGVGLAVSPATIATGGFDEQWSGVSHGILGEALVRSMAFADEFTAALAVLGNHSPDIRLFEFE